MKPILFAVVLWSAAGGAFAADDLFAGQSKDQKVHGLMFQLEYLVGMCDRKIPSSVSDGILHWMVIDDIDNADELKLRSMAELNGGYLQGRAAGTTLDGEGCMKMIKIKLNELQAIIKP